MSREAQLIEAFDPAESRLGRRKGGRRNDEARPCEYLLSVLDTNRIATGSSSVRMALGYCFGHARADIGLKPDKDLPEERERGPINVRIQVPQIAGTEFGLAQQGDGLTRKLGEALEVSLNSWTDTVAFHIQRTLTACLKVETLVVSDEEQRVAGDEDSESVGNEDGAGIVHEADNDEDDSILKLEYCWFITLDVTCLSYYGNIFDSAFLCALLALVDLRLPVTTWDAERKWWRANGEIRKLATQDLLKWLPIPVTSLAIDDGYIVDPDLEEAGGEGVPVTLIHLVPVVRDKRWRKSIGSNVKYDLFLIGRPGASRHQLRMTEEFDRIRELSIATANESYVDIVKLLKE